MVYRRAHMHMDVGWGETELERKRSQVLHKMSRYGDCLLRVALISQQNSKHLCNFQTGQRHDRLILGKVEFRATTQFCSFL